MKNVLDWAKKHWLIIVLSLVALAAAPTALFFSMDMAQKLKDEVQQKTDEKIKGVTATKVEYKVVLADGTIALQKSTDVNKPHTEAYARLNKEQADLAAALAKQGEEFNKADHGLLLDGLFPTPSELEKESKTKEFLDLYTQKFHQDLLNRYGAGKPPPANDMYLAISQHVQNERARIKAERGSDDLSDDEKQKLARELFAIRLQAVQRRAKEISFYADLSVFSGVTAIDVNSRPTPAQLWDLQERAWIHADVVRAIARVNGSETGPSSGGVPASVVKRVVRIVPDRAAYESGLDATYDPGADKPAPNFSASLTGRVSGPGTQNKWYDVRPVDLEVIVSSQRLPQFIDALAETNFFTILDLDLQTVDVFDELKGGQYYGEENVVRALIRVESVFLRSWRAGSMPEAVKRALGMVEGVTGQSDPNAGGGAAPAPSRRGGRRDDRGGGGGGGDDGVQPGEGG